MKSIQMIPVADVVPTPDNKRAIKPGDPTIEGLAASMNDSGLLQAIVCRPHPKKKGKYDLRAGERRLMAARLLGWKEIAASVDPDMTDDQAIRITTIENLQREDLSPLESARSIDLLRTKSGLDFETIGAMIGMPAAHCARRAGLLNLSPLWMKSIDDGRFSGWTAGHLELVARLAPGTQDALHRIAVEAFEEPGFVDATHVSFDDVATLPKLADWRRIVDAELMSLSAMPWDPADLTLDPKAGACSECPKQTAKQALLFADDGDGDGRTDSRCLDRACFEHKVVLNVRRGLDAAKAAAPDGKVAIYNRDNHGFFRDDKARYAIDAIEKDMPRVGWNQKMAEKPGRGRVPCVITGGPLAGQVRYVSADGREAASDHVRSNGAAAKKKAKTEDKRSPAQIRKERMARLVKRRETFAINHIREQINKLKFGKETEVHVVASEAIKLAICFGFRRQLAYVETSAWKDLDKGLEHIGKMAWDLVVPTIHRRLDPGMATEDRDFKAVVADTQRFCKQLALDWDEALVRAEEAIGDPKWLQHEKVGADASKSKNVKTSKSKKKKKKTAARNGSRAAGGAGDE